MSLSPEIRSQIDSIVQSGPVVLFMKGNAMQPQCGFSARVVEILNRLVPSYVTFDVLGDPDIREGIKEYSDWPTIPQLYVGGEFQGGCDIVTEMYDSGELHQALGVPLPDVSAVELTVTPRAAEVLREAQSRYPGESSLQVSIDANFQHAFGFGPRQEGFVEVDGGAMTVLMDRDSAARAQGLVLDALPAPGGELRLTLANPNARSPHVKQIAASDLESLGESGTARIYDVRTAEERTERSLQGSILLDEAAAADLEQLELDTPLVFVSDRGGRSQAAAEHYARLGFSNVAVLEGGLEAAL